MEIAFWDDDASTAVSICSIRSPGPLRCSLEEPFAEWWRTLGVAKLSLSHYLYSASAVGFGRTTGYGVDPRRSYGKGDRP
jgi:hypothetical protein